jgi:phosphatidate phosphatase APP1
LHKVQLIQNTLFEDPKPVPGMPELYANLSQSLSNPSFTYVTGSTFPLVPFLRDFIHGAYPAAPGAVLAKNITLGGLVNLASNIFEGEATKDHKLAQIERLHELWPNKQFLTIGDSGEQDPETYGQAFRTHGGDVIKCIWIRALNDTDADNSDARFAAAFQGVPKERVRVYSDDDILNVLPTIDVAGGSC